ncbi:hypothetical protein GCM10023082_36450 [Streptomyces tremellae]|uniref:Uncharacterized protein n=1 Tax=Streptomyces tremellae TaxID=1124239 RepID=A0ABP7FD17_9ACTN
MPGAVNDAVLPGAMRPASNVPRPVPVTVWGVVSLLVTVILVVAASGTRRPPPGERTGPSGLRGRAARAARPARAGAGHACPVSKRLILSPRTVNDHRVRMWP